MQYEYPGNCPVINTICIENDLGLIAIGSSPPSNWNRYFNEDPWIAIDGRTTKGNQLLGQVVFRNGWTSHFDAGTISNKPVFVTMPGADCSPGYTCRNYYPVEVELESDHGDSGAGFYRVQSNGSGGFSNNAYGILSFGKTVGSTIYTYYYAWDQPFHADWNDGDQRTVYPCTSSNCPL